MLVTLIRGQGNTSQIAFSSSRNWPFYFNIYFIIIIFCLMIDNRCTSVVHFIWLRSAYVTVLTIISSIILPLLINVYHWKIYLILLVFKYLFWLVLARYYVTMSTITIKCVHWKVFYSTWTWPFMQKQNA